QLDRFLMRLSIGYPDRASELRMLDKMPHELAVTPVMSLEELNGMRGLVGRIAVSEQVKAYILMIVSATRTRQEIKLGCSPRASIALYKASQAFAFMNNRSFVTPDDVKELASSVLSHRIILASGQNAFLNAEQIIANIIADTVVPV
ncbi:MAG TPA: magnesium chelatase, partial [Ruminococcaceae bacterium]|nr:magnesium chelatase [Oscillospiraceae bacterium]